MKKLLSIDQHQYGLDAGILIARVLVAGAMLTHGIPKFISLVNYEFMFPSVFGLSPAISLSLTVFAEVICSIFILLGIGTRLAVIPLIAVMAIAVFHIHAADGFAKQELGLLYLLIYSLLFITGSGKFSMDALIRRKNQKASYALQ